jgi:thiamine kinase-like enzyme
LNTKLNNIISNFIIKGSSSITKLSNYQITKLDKGHINDTYIVEGSKEKYILQRINHEIFKDVPGLINNILLVTKHIASKLDIRHKTQVSRQSENDEFLIQKLILFPTKEQKYYYKDDDENYWRMYNFIEGASYNIIDKPVRAYKAGKAFGKFQEMLSDLPADLLTETIPNFHNMKTRYEAFKAIVNKDSVNRVNKVKTEIQFIEAHIGEMLGMQELIDNGEIPLRITHNDTKVNNILFNRNDDPVCIVDLDTVMPGSVLYDFGDAIRTAANTASEDEADLSLVKMNIELFEAYTKGYLDIARSFLNKAEIENLALSAKYITFIMGLRFMTDYIDGDNYYKIHYENQNLQRAKVQFKLVESMDKQFEEMKKIINVLICKLN